MFYCFLFNSVSMELPQLTIMKPQRCRSIFTVLVFCKPWGNKTNIPQQIITWSLGEAGKKPIVCYPLLGDFFDKNERWHVSKGCEFCLSCGCQLYQHLQMTDTWGYARRELNEEAERFLGTERWECNRCNCPMAEGKFCGKNTRFGCFIYGWFTYMKRWNIETLPHSRGNMPW